MNQNLLFEILGVLIGFCGIMLVLSLLVTALTQLIVYWLNIRARNLELGLSDLLATAQEQSVEPTLVEEARDYAAKCAAKDGAKAIVEALKDAKAAPQAIAIAEENYAKALLASKKAENARKKLETSSVSADKNSQKKSQDKNNYKELAGKILNSNSLMRGTKPGRTSWILKEELEMLLHEEKEFSSDVIEKAMWWFSRMERGLTQRFKIHVRRLTLACAILIAVVFQVNAPDVLKRLATDPEYRVRAAMAASDLVSEYKTNYPEPVRYEDVSSMALEQLQKNHPELQEMLEQVSGVGNTMDDILDELSLVLEGHPKREALVLEYKSTLEKLQREGYEDTLRIAQASVSRLALLDITPLSKGVEFYWDMSNLLGVAVTAVLISLGAPFWFNALRRLVNLRDALAPEDRDRKAAKQQK